MGTNEMSTPKQKRKARMQGLIGSRANPRGLVVCFITSYPPNRARLSEYAYNLLSKLADLPTISKVYVLADKTEGLRKNQSDKIEIKSVWSHDNPISIIKILLEILKIKPDLVH